MTPRFTRKTKDVISILLVLGSIVGSISVPRQVDRPSVLEVALARVLGADFDLDLEVIVGLGGAI